MAKPAPAPKPKRAAKSAPQSQNRLVTAVVVTALITTILSAAGVLFFQRLTTSETASAPIAATTPKYENFVYYEFPKLTVYLKKTGNRPVGLAVIRVSAEFNDAEPLPACKQAQARILDAMQTFLRDRTRDELDGHEGTDLLRASFLNIVNDAVVPYQANTVLFREIQIQ